MVRGDGDDHLDTFQRHATASELDTQPYGLGPAGHPPAPGSRYASDTGGGVGSSVAPSPLMMLAG